jgi:hypothetical protein
MRRGGWRRGRVRFVRGGGDRVSRLRVDVRGECRDGRRLELVVAFFDFLIVVLGLRGWVLGQERP